MCPATPIRPGGGSSIPRPTRAGGLRVNVSRTDDDKTKSKPKESNMFRCQECGRRVGTVGAAERASNRGCPKCGGCDIDIDIEAAAPAGWPRPGDRVRVLDDSEKYSRGVAHAGTGRVKALYPGEPARGLLES